MPVMVIIRAPKVTPETFDAVREKVGWDNVPAAGAISHAIAFPDNGAVEVTVWETRKAFDAYFATRLEPVLLTLGIQLDDVEVLETRSVAVGPPCLAYMIPPGAEAATASALATAH
jgi:hypothetical protein